MYLLWLEARTSWPAMPVELVKVATASTHVQQIGTNLGGANLCLSSCLTGRRLCTGLLSYDPEATQHDLALRNVALHKWQFLGIWAIDLPCLRSGRLSGDETARAGVQHAGGVQKSLIHVALGTLRD